MKRLIALLLIIGLALAMAGCGDFAPDPTATAAQAADYSFDRANFPLLAGGTAQEPLAEAVAAIMLGETREAVQGFLDFGSTGNEFFTSWFDHMPQLNRAAFRAELQSVVEDLRNAGGLLSNLAGMRSQCRSGRVCDDSYGFYAETPNYEYCLRCTPRRGEYNFYLYCYDKQAQREHREHRKQSEPASPAPTRKHKKQEMER